MEDEAPRPSIAGKKTRTDTEIITDGGPETTRKSSVIKRVRIQTPPPLSPDPITPQDEYSFESKYPIYEQAASPPPPEATTDQLPASLGGFEYSFVNRQALESEFFPNQEVADNTRRNSATTSAQPSNSKPPYNPFQKTLATIEPSRDSALLPKAGPGNGAKSALDVDAFKRLLMTGKADHDSSLGMPTVAGAVVAGAIFGPSDSSTNTSSTSPQAPSNERSASSHSSSRSSLDEAESVGEEDESSPANNSSRESMPPPSSHRHGKLATQRTPQVVSFSDFSTTGSGISSIKSFSQASDGIFSVSNPSELDKPSSAGKGPPSVMSPPPPPRTSAQEIEGISLPPRTTQRVPPPPPASRSHNRNRSTSNTSNTSTASASAAGNGLANSPALKQAPPNLKPPSLRAPPPPPARRAGIKTIPSPEPAQTPDISESVPQNEDGFSLAPTYPPRPSMGSTGSSRSLSFSSRGGTGVPPPPPPRRRGSSKGSVDVPRVGPVSPGNSRRTSIEQHRASMDSVRRVSGASEVDTGRRESGDVLADLSALQAEVEALRQRVRPI